MVEAFGRGGGSISIDAVLCVWLGLWSVGKDSICCYMGVDQNYGPLLVP